MIDVYNFALHSEPFTIYKPLKVTISKCKFLQKTVNSILKWLGAKEEITNIKIHRITLNRPEIYLMTQQVIHEFHSTMCREPTHIIFGYDFFSKLHLDPDTPIRALMTLDTESFLGFKVILHPMINGMIPVAVEI